MATPLEGVRVLDLTRLLPGGFATLLLADLGADVIKIEDLKGGDYLRWIPPPHLFQALDRGKRSLALDLRHPRGREAFLKLVARCDVVVESFRPGTLESERLGWEALRQANPRVIVCALSGYGQAARLAQKAGHDINYAALDGLLAAPLAGPLSGPRIGKSRPLPVQVADFCGGYAAALAIAAALHGRQASGEGAFLDVSLAASALPLLLPRIGVEQLTGALGCYNVYETADGRAISVGALEPKFFERLLAAAGRADLLELHYDTAGQEDLKRELAGLFRTRTRDEWEQFFAAHDACVEPVLEPEEALRRMAGNDPLAVVAPLGRTASAPAPGYGQHTEQVLLEFGFSAEEIAALRASGAAM